MPPIVEVIVLAVVQGIAEFLPISSSGHLVIIGSWLGKIDEEPTLEILLHAGTLGSIIVVFWKRILRLLTEDRRVIGLLVVGTIPAAFFGILIKSQFKEWLRSPMLAGCMLILTAGILWWLGRLSRSAAPQKDATEAKACSKEQPSYVVMSFLKVLVVGCFQAFAILPGISRSGSTILGGRLMGLNRDDALTLSFLLAIPAIGGASVLALKDLKDQIDAGEEMKYSLGQLGLGTCLAFLVGIFALRWLIRWNQSDRLPWFAWWCLPMGILVIAMQFAS
ncbi:MAG: undecaprenyl-diphosphate phosphatase [Planctomycetota bacterium]